jgi:hypothetical protein
MVGHSKFDVNKLREFELQFIRGSLGTIFSVNRIRWPFSDATRLNVELAASRLSIAKN